jgi:hypothetical protein
MIGLVSYFSDLASDLDEYKPYFAAGSLTLAGGALVGPWESTRIIGLTTLAGMTWATAAHYIIHQKEKSLFSGVESFEWMQAICQSSIISALAGTILAALACIPCGKLPLKVTAKQLAPYFAVSPPLILLVSHIRSHRSAEKERTSHANHYQAYQTTFTKSTAQMFLGGTVLLSIAIVAARAGVINLGSPSKFLTTRSQ